MAKKKVTNTYNLDGIANKSDRPQKYDEFYFELENLKLGYSQNFEEANKRTPDEPELTFAKVCLESAKKAYTNFPSDQSKYRRKVELLKFVEWIEERIKQLEKPNKNEPKSFEELFYDRKQIPNYIEVLKQGSTNILNDNGHFIGGKNDKCIIVAWTTVLIDKGKMKKTDSRQTTIELLKKQFPGFTISSKFSNSSKKYQPALTYFKKHL